MTKNFRLKDSVLNEYGIGYVPDKRFNKRFKEQGLNCPYEHCIETTPLHREEEMEAVKQGLIIDLRKDPVFNHMNQQRIKELPKERPELYKEIRKVLDSRGMKDDECWFFPDLNAFISSTPTSCQLYGHECPGGEKQVEKCDLEGMFENSLRNHK